MATVVDAAREDMWLLNFNTTYQKGNDNPNTPTPTWVQSKLYSAAGTVETHIPSGSGGTGVNNTLDAWLPASAGVYLSVTRKTVHFT